MSLGKIWARLSLPGPGWRTRLLALALGAVSALAFTPIFAVPILWPAFIFLALQAASAARVRDAALTGWLFGVGHFAVGIYWIGNAFLVDRATYGWMMPFAVFGMAAGMAIYIAIAAAATRWAMAVSGVGRPLLPVAFAASWMAAEWLRSWVLTGFPWNPIASVWAVSPEMMQAAAWIGTPGLGFLTVLVFTSPAAGWHWRPAEARPGVAVFVGGSVLLPLLLYAFGHARIAATTVADHPGIVLRLIQANIPQAEKWVPALKRGHVIKQMRMSRRSPGPAGPPTHVVWGETMVPFVIEPNSDIPGMLAAAVPKGGAMIFGAPRQDQAGKVFNSAFAIDDDGRVAATYDKAHLVPFGEYVPLRGILPIEKLTPGRGDFAAGPGPRNMAIKGLPPFGVLICYEIIFAGQVTDPAKRPEWLLNLTNDGWFGLSSGPYQHLAAAQLRAIEEGLPVVRVANTGISAVIDANGRVRNMIGLDEQGVADVPLPTALPPPPFARTGTGPSVAAVFLLLAGLAAAGWRRRRRQD
ncbi:MAG: apolipoprotein N-acyltransferase [Proteobacteria bacterium]|nr:apolipoprotein N-acyltransferase [Pseudomonadota bacterium]